MTNSLSKDSHITLSICHPKSQYSSKVANMRGRRVAYSAVNKINLNNCIDKPANISFSGFSNVNIYKSKRFKDFLVFASESQVVFSALFALFLAGILRPATIMALPGKKKNKDDKKYASAHSIASGVIGLAVSTLIGTPISKAIKRIEMNPRKYIGDNFSYLGELKSDGLVGEGFKKATKCMNMIPEAIKGVPQAILTVALIPPILKHVFGYERKKAEVKADISPLSQNYSLINFSSLDSKKKIFKSFSGETK